MANKYCDFDATVMCGVKDDKCHLQCLKLKMHNRVCRNMSYFNTPRRIPHLQLVTSFISLGERKM